MWFCALILCCIVIVSANCVYLDIDENLIFKICNMKFCDATKTHVSVNVIYLWMQFNLVEMSDHLQFLDLQHAKCDLTYCFEQMSSERKFGNCPESANSSARSLNCFDDCDGLDYR